MGFMANSFFIRENLDLEAHLKIRKQGLGVLIDIDIGKKIFLQWIKMEVNHLFGDCIEQI